MSDVRLGARTLADIENQVVKVLRGIGNPEPPLDLRIVRDALKLDRAYYSTTDDGVLRETVRKLRVAGVQVLRRPTLLLDAVQKLNLKALYLPDRKRILLDQSLPLLKHRWNEAHEIGHDIIPWHSGMMLGDSDLTLTLGCHAQMEAEANYGAGHLLFLGNRFREESTSSPTQFATVRSMTKVFGNTLTSTLYRYVEQADTPMLGLVSAHPHPSRQDASFDPTVPCRHCVASSSFLSRFGRPDPIASFSLLAGYCGGQGGGFLGEAEIPLKDLTGIPHLFRFETFFNRYHALTLAVYAGPQRVLIPSGDIRSS